VSRRLAAAAATAVIFCAASCRRAPSTFAGAPVVLIVVDTLRADHLPAYGYRGVDTPHLDELARGSIVFENAVAQVPLTLPSHATLFTGLLPFENGVRDNIGYRLGPERSTLASLLAERGYATGGAVSAVVLDGASGIGRGFQFYEDSIESRRAAEPVGRVQRAGDRTRRLLEDWITRQPAGRPFLAFLHIYEPHAPYEPPEPFRSRYAGRLYDGEIATADAIVGDFVAFLKARGLYDRALVIFLSDHGEALGAHGEDEHGIFLYRETTRVPLFIKLPGSRAGRREAATAGLVDVVPTVLSVLGEKAPPRLSGVSLLSSSRAPRSRRVYSESLYPRLHLGWSDLASLTDDRYQYVEAPRPELYDWIRDPAEKDDLSRGLPPAFRSMRRELQSMSRPRTLPGAADPEAAKKLVSLGYIAAASPNATRKNLPDPKDSIGSLDALKTAGGLLERGREEEAIALLRRVCREQPDMVDAWETLAGALRRAGRFAEARDALREADRLSPGTAPILLGLSDVSIELKDYESATRYAEAARVVGASSIHGELAAIAAARGDLAAARAEALAARREHPGAQAPLLQLARIERQAGNLPEALRYAEEGLRLAGSSAPVEGIRAVGADLLAHLGREPEAEAAFREEVRDYPGNVDAWQRLALLYASAGRMAELRAWLDRMSREVPPPRGFEAAARVCEIIGDRGCAADWKRKAQSSRLNRESISSNSGSLFRTPGPTTTGPAR